MKRGEHYIIRNSTISGKSIVEGKAVLCKRAEGHADPGSELWYVQFPRESHTFLRVVYKKDKVPEDTNPATKKYEYSIALMKVIEAGFEYLEMDFDRLGILMALDELTDEQFNDIRGWVAFCEKEDSISPGAVTSNIMHDLAGVHNKEVGFSPRTKGYAKHLTTG